MGSACAIQDAINVTVDDWNNGPFSTPQIEREALLREALKWNEKSPRWGVKNQCGEQSKALLKHLEQVLKLTHYRLTRVERYHYFGPWRVYHNMIQVSPSPANPDSEVYYLDGFKGGLPWQDRNRENDVKMGTLSELKQSYPHTNDPAAADYKSPPPSGPPYYFHNGPSGVGGGTYGA